MQILSLQDFLDASAFERAALAAVFPLVDAASGPRGGLDLRTNTINIAVSSIVGSNGRDELIQELRPLIFGAAWKVLDLIVELGLNQNTPVARWTIAAKARDAASARVPTLSSDPDIWGRIAATYASSVEQRHCLVHRSFSIAPDGSMVGMSTAAGNASVADLTVPEQAAFCRLAQRCAVVLAAANLSTRERLDLVACLDGLAAHHGLGALGAGAPATAPVLVQVDAVPNGLHWTVDTQRALAAAQTTFPGRPYFDIEIHFGTTGIPALVGRLEDAPQSHALPIDPRNPPPWTTP